MTSGEQGTRRLQTLYDRQRPRLRERVLQQCQARGCPTVNVNHLDLVLDNQRNQLTDSADLNIVSLERQALKALGFDSGPAAEGTAMAASQPYQQAPPIDNQQPPQASQQQYGTPQATQQQYGTSQQYGTPQQQYGTPQATQQQYGTPQQQYGTPQAPQQQYGTPQATQQQYNPPQQQAVAQHQYTAENTGLYEQVPHHKMGGDYRTGDSGLPQPQAPPPQQTTNQGQATPYGIGTRILPSKERLARRPSRSDAEISEFQSPVTHGRRSISDSTGQSHAVVHGRRSAGQSDDSYPPAATYPPAAMPTGRISGLQGQVRSQIPLDMGHYGPLAPQHGGQLAQPQASGFNARAGIVDEFSVLAQREERQMEQRELADKMAIKEKQRQFYSDLKQQEDEKAQIQIRRQQEEQRFHHQQVQQQEQWRQQESEQALKQQQARMLGNQARVQDLETRRYMENQARNQAIEADRMAMQNLKMMENNQQNDGRNSKRDQLMQMQVDITRERQRKEQHRAQQIQQERQHMSQYSANLDQQDQQRLAHQNMIAARGNAMHGVNAGNFEAADKARQADEQAFLENLNRLEEIEQRKAAEKANKAYQGQIQYRRDLDEQVQRKGAIKQQRQQEVLSERDRIRTDLDRANSEEARKQAELAQRNNHYLHQIQAQMGEKRGVDFGRHDIEISKRAPFPAGYAKSQCDGSFFMSETERRMNGLL